MPQVNHLNLPPVGKAVLALNTPQDRAASYALAIGRDNDIRPIGNGIPGGKRFPLYSLTRGTVGPHECYDAWHPALDHAYHFKCRNSAVAIVSYNYGPVGLRRRADLPPGLDVYVLPVSAYGLGTAAYLYVREGMEVEYDETALALHHHTQDIEFA
ncbi:hypothetical protein [Ruegeria sp. HKCCA5763]|uniref:hypothetical protein n=1 Tax=Ruegeria sp. HKCCA5763 TaxID=2682987 RepID=UPI001489892B|nr:hypothetical protein [Ruegeria sp. HKCCA5763]